MQKRSLGSTAIEVSRIGLGTVKFGRNQGVKYPDAFELPDDKTVRELLSLAASLGMNLLDTAPAYGTSEERLGKALQGERQAWVIVSKVGEECVNGESRFDFSASTVRESVQRSLRRLKTDYLDVVLVHSSGEDEQIIEKTDVFATLAALKQAGWIRAYGMSTKTVAGGLLTLDHADVAMVTLNAAHTSERVVIQRAAELKKGILIKKALASGHLHDLPGAHQAAAALQFVLAEPGVTSVMVGTLNPAHLRQNALLLAE